MKHLFLALITVAWATTLQAQTTTTLPDKPEVILVQGGTFTMGSSVEEDEKPHLQKLESYSIGKYPVTVGQYKKYCTATGTAMPVSPFYGWNDKSPIVNVNYYDAVAYCRWLGKQYGGDWRFPTEAQWEFAARGGNESKGYTYSGGNDLEEVAWYRQNSGYKSHTVGLKKPNELGIYDMSGNVSEWCKNWYGEYNPKFTSHDPFIVIRGGSWFDSATSCRVACRDYFDPSYSNERHGFRVVLSQ